MQYQDEKSREEELTTEHPGTERTDEKTIKEPTRRKSGFRGSLLWRLVSNKFFLAFMIFFVWILFFDSNNLINRFKVKSELRQMELQKRYYLQEISQNELIRDQLMHDLEQVETYGRERYLMKRDQEDVYLIIEEGKE